MPATQADKARAIVEIVTALCETVEKSNQTIGCPAGPMYAALMAQGCTLQQFERLMELAVASGRITKRGDCYFAAKPE